MKKKILISTIAVCVVSIACILVIDLCKNKHKHSYSDTWSSDSTKHWHESTCGHDVKSDEAEHTFGDWIIDVEATEEQTGSKSRCCTVCEYKETAVIDELTHTHKFDIATWTYDSTKHWHESTCGHDVMSDEAEHTFGDWTIDIESTEEITGSKSRSCTVCEYKETAVIDKLPHTHKFDIATWSYDKTKHWHASTCGHDVKSDEAEHDWNENFVCNVCGYNYSSPGLVYTLSEDGLRYIISDHLSNLPENVIIPSFYCGKPVTSIGDCAFHNCSSLTSIVIPDSITSIEDEAFSDCSNLINITIGNGVTSIGDTAFSRCMSLTSIVTPDSITRIGVEAFSRCMSLTSVTLGNSLVSIGEAAFSYCWRLVEVINKSSLNIVKGSDDNGEVAFDALNVKKDGKSEIVNVNGYLFYPVEEINYLVSYVGKETSIVLPDNYKGESYVINQYAFYNCSNLISIVIENSVISIGNFAFHNCSSLTSVILGNSVISIGDTAFYGCSHLSLIYYLGTHDDWNNISIGANNDNLTNATKYYYSEKVPTNTTYNYWHYVDGIPTNW